jgi:hypothetical protein
LAQEFFKVNEVEEVDVVGLREFDKDVYIAL